MFLCPAAQQLQAAWVCRPKPRQGMLIVLAQLRAVLACAMWSSLLGSIDYLGTLHPPSGPLPFRFVFSCSCRQHAAWGTSGSSCLQVPQCCTCGDVCMQWFLIVCLFPCGVLPPGVRPLPVLPTIASLPLHGWAACGWLFGSRAPMPWP